MKIHTESLIGSDGVQYITIEASEPRINERGLWEGGRFYSFGIDHKHQTTKLEEFSYRHGVPCGFTECLKKWKDEVLTAGECLKYCEENYK